MKAEAFVAGIRDLTDEVDGCWIWKLRKSWDGYGKVNLYGRTHGLAAHRIAHELFIGPIPEGMTVDHICFQPGCVNPTHLRLLTVQENSSNQRRTRKSECIRGHSFTAENTYIQAGSRRRQCRSCARMRQATTPPTATSDPAGTSEQEQV